MPTKLCLGRLGLLAAFVAMFAGACIRGHGQTNFAVLTSDGGWTWYNDPRAIYHNGILYFGYVRADGKTALSCFDPSTGKTTDLWQSGFTQRDDHNNPGLLAKSDGRLLAIYARHGSDRFFTYRLSNSTNPVSPSDWFSEQQIADTGAGLTYANPFQLSAEGGKIYNFSRNQNFNPTLFTSVDGGSSWSAPQMMIRAGSGGVRPYVKYDSDGLARIDFLYTDGHPRNITNSLYHLYYQGGFFYKTDGSPVKNAQNLPILHDSGERGSVIYRYSDLPAADPDEHIAAGRAWCWENVHEPTGPVALFTVQKDAVTGPNWYDARVYYYYARWTGTNWQKRFIAHAGRPLYTPEDDYAGGICADPENPSVIYISSNAADPFDLEDLKNVPLRAESRYELWRGVTEDGGLNFTWTQVTSNSAVDNLRPYIPRGQTGTPAVIWFRGDYPTFTTYNCEVAGLFPQPVPTAPQIEVVSPAGSVAVFTNLANSVWLEVQVRDDGVPEPVQCQWTKVSGPGEVSFSDPGAPASFAGFSSAGLYVVRCEASDGLSSRSKEVVINAGEPVDLLPDGARALWLKLDGAGGPVAMDSSPNQLDGTISGAVDWRPESGQRGGALAFDGLSTVVTVPDSPLLDNLGAFTLAFWFKANAYPADSAGLVCKRDGPTTENSYTCYLKASNKLLYIDIEGSNNRFSSASQIELGRWYHVALVFDGFRPAATRAALYLNGELDVTAMESSSVVSNHTSHLRLGNTHANAVNWFNGLMDDVRFYRRVLAPAEILSMAATNQAPSIFVRHIEAAQSGVPVGFEVGLSDDGPTGGMTVSWSQLGGPPADFLKTNSADAVVTFPRAGLYELRIVAEDAQVGVAQVVETIVASNTNVFADWIEAYFNGDTNETVTSAAADPDRDAVSNLMEFALGLNPTLADSQVFRGNEPGLPSGEIQSHAGTNYLSLKVRRPSGRLGISYSAMGGPVLLGFPSGWVAAEAGEPERTQDGSEIVIFRDVVPASEASMRFMRLQVSQP